MPYALLDDQFHANPKVRAAGLDGAGLYALSLSYCGDFTTDGFVPRWWVKAIVGRKNKLIERLVTSGLWHETGPGDVLEMEDRKGNNVCVQVRETGFFIPDFVLLNVSSVEAANRRLEKSAAGRKGAIKRWSDSSSHSSSHTPDDGSSHSRKDGSSHVDNHGKRDGKTIARARGPLPQPLPPSAVSTPTSTTTADAGLTRANPKPPASAPKQLEPNTADPIVKLAAALHDRDAATERVLRHNFGGLPEAAFAYTLEEIQRTRTTQTIDSEAGLATTILQRIADTGLIGDPETPKRALSPLESRAGASGVDPVVRRERFVRANGWRLPDDELVFQLVEMGAGEGELERLGLLVAELRGGVAAA